MFRTLAQLLPLLLLCVPARAAEMIEWMTADSPIIVRGQVRHLSPHIVQIAVDEVIKGDVTSSTIYAIRAGPVPFASSEMVLFLAPIANEAGTDGAWGVYPFFPSGIVVISDINNGLIVLRDHAATLAQQSGRLGFAVAAVEAQDRKPHVRA